MRNTVEVFEAFKLSNGNIFAFLKCDKGKLSSGTILQDGKGRRWRVMEYVWTTGSIASHQARIQEEGRNIFQYQLRGLNHEEKPVIHTSLRINNSA